MLIQRMLVWRSVNFQGWRPMPARSIRMSSWLSWTRWRCTEKSAGSVTIWSMDKGVVLVRPGPGERPAPVYRWARAANGVVVCERHVREVALLYTSVRMATFGKGLLPLHNVALTHRGIARGRLLAALRPMVALVAPPVKASWTGPFRSTSRCTGLRPGRGRAR